MGFITYYDPIAFNTFINVILWAIIAGIVIGFFTRTFRH